MARPFTFHEFGPWPLGMARLERLTDYPPQALLDVVNADVRPTGSIVTAPWWEQVLPGNAHSLFACGDKVYGVVNDQLGELTENAFVPLGFSTPERLSWTDILSTPYFTDGSWVYRISNGVQQLTATSDWQDLDDVLVDMPGGHWLSYWNGRLLVARGQSLLFSQPLRYGAHNPLTDYIELGSRAIWLAPLEFGVYIGLKDRVLWAEGASPSEFKIRTVAGETAPGAALVVDGEVFGKALPSRSVVFFTASGFAIGDGQGIVTYPQADRFSGLPLFEGKILRVGTRLYFVRRLQ